MDSSNSKIFKILKAVGIFILSWIIITFIEVKYSLFTRTEAFGKSEVFVGISFLFFALIPIVWIRSSNLLKGFIKFLGIYLIVAFVFPPTYNTLFGWGGSKQKTTNYTTSINGRYYVDEPDRSLELVVLNDIWHCTVKIQGANGYIHTDEVFGTVSTNNDLMDSKYNMPIGQVDGTYAEIMVYSRPSTLTKISE